LIGILQKPTSVKIFAPHAFVHRQTHISMNFCLQKPHKNLKSRSSCFMLYSALVHPPSFIQVHGAIKQSAA